MGNIKIIAIDGPAASGKSTLGKKLADEYGYLFFDTGVMYRAITWLAIERDVDLDDETAIAKLAEETDIDVRPPSIADGRSSDVLIERQDITWEIRRSEVDENVSQVAAYPQVRKALTGQQRRIGLRGNVVMVGRDIGTVVLPEAELKIYLDASVEERARRRYEEMLQRSEPANYQEILSAMRKRDRIDSTRAIAPLKAAQDAIVLHSNGMDAQEVFEHVKRLVKNHHPIASS